MFCPYAYGTWIWSSLWLHQTAPGHQQAGCWSKRYIQPFAKSNGRFFFRYKINMMPSSYLYYFWWGHKMHASVNFLCKIYWLCTGVFNAGSVMFFKSSLNIIANFLLKLVGFKLNFLNFKHETLSLSHQNFMAIGLTVTNPSANKCRSLCKLISNSRHADLGQTNDGIVMKLRYHRQEWISQSLIMP